MRTSRTSGCALFNTGLPRATRPCRAGTARPGPSATGTSIVWLREGPAFDAGPLEAGGEGRPDAPQWLDGAAFVFARLQRKSAHATAVALAPIIRAPAPRPRGVPRRCRRRRPE